jgi:hypothetical protein
MLAHAYALATDITITAIEQFPSDTQQLGGMWRFQLMATM